VLVADRQTRRDRPSFGERAIVSRRRADILGRDRGRSGGNAQSPLPSDRRRQPLRSSSEAGRWTRSPRPRLRGGDCRTTRIRTDTSVESPKFVCIRSAMHPGGLALLLPQILPVFSVVAPCRPGASPPSVRQRTSETRHWRTGVVGYHRSKSGPSSIARRRFGSHIAAKQIAP